MAPRNRYKFNSRLGAEYAVAAFVRFRNFFLPVLALLMGACGTSSPSGDSALDGSVSDSGVDGALQDATQRDSGWGPDYLARIQTETEYDSLANSADEVKFLTRADGREPWVPGSECLFQNTARFPYHVGFLQNAFPELRSVINYDLYVEGVLRNAQRRQWGGSFLHRSRTTHPVTNVAGIYAYTIYQDENGGVSENLSADQIVELDTRLKQCAPALASRIVFFPQGRIQTASVRTLATTLRERGIAIRFPEEQIERDVEGYSLGEGYGTLLVIQNGQPVDGSYGPRDIVVAGSAPNEISLVAGLIVAFPQNLYSHVNLRLREKQIPSVTLRDALTDARVTANAGQLVHVVVRATEVVIERTTLAEAEAFWARQRPNVGSLRSNLNVETLAPFSALHHIDAIAYGVKAANLAEIRIALPAENRPDGFGVPFDAYRDFIVHNTLTATVAALSTDTRVRSDRAYRVAQLDSLRNQIKRGNLVPGFLDSVRSAARGVFGSTADTMYLRFRSSTNAEDLEGVSGAGLYESATGCLADDDDADTTGPSRCMTPEFDAYLRAERVRLMSEISAHPERTWLPAMVADIDGELSEEKTVANAVRKVWRSVWNLRAFDEREYYGLSHNDVYMGMAVIRRFVMEERESVAVTNLTPDDGLPLYRVISQMRDIGVVRPADPTAVAEVLTFRRATANGLATPNMFRVDVRCNRSDQELWSETSRTELAGLLMRLHDHFSTSVYPTTTNLRLDVEVEVIQGRIILKQARPYLGTI